MTQVVQDIRGTFALPQAAAQNQLIHKIGRVNRRFRQKFRTVEEQEQEFKQSGICIPSLEQRGSSTVRRDESVQPRQYAVGIRQNPRGRIESWTRDTGLGT